MYNLQVRLTSEPSNADILLSEEPVTSEQKMLLLETQHTHHYSEQDFNFLNPHLRVCSLILERGREMDGE